MGFGSIFGDDMRDSDMVELDGMGMGGEFMLDDEDAEAAAMEAEMTLDEAMMDGMDAFEM
jgi:hypothetical protein